MDFTNLGKKEKIIGGVILAFFVLILFFIFSGDDTSKAVKEEVVNENYQLCSLENPIIVGKNYTEAGYFIDCLDDHGWEYVTEVPDYSDGDVCCARK